jgi:hypothetical protein
VNDCSPTRTLMWAWAAGRLPEDQKSAVMDHLEACGSCSALGRIYKATTELSAWPESEIPLPANLQNLLLEAVQESKKVPEPPEGTDLEAEGATPAPA